MLGSHNSMSYLKPIHWWQRWQKPWYRCQEINLVQQYKQGARYFDIRVNLINDEWHFVHNKIDFGHIHDGLSELDPLIELAEKESQKIYFRIIFDRRKTPKTKEEQERLLDKFHNLIKWITNAYIKYNVVYLDSVIVYWNWEEIYVHPLRKIVEYHNSVSNKNNLLKYLLGNKHFAKKHNKRGYTFHERMIIGNHEVILMDYINIK